MLKDSLGPGFMFCHVVREDEEAVHVNDEPSFSNHVSEGIRHEMLECGGGGELVMPQNMTVGS